MTVWDEDLLWEKAKLYVERARNEDQSGPWFPFWSILALELLGRAVLASVHPALLADPREGEHILYAFGYGAPKRPRSIAAWTVFNRCSKVVEDFTEGDAAGAISLIELRNEELHSGGTPFAGLSTGVWLADYYRLCQILLSALGKELDDLFGEDDARAAETMIAGAAEEIEGEVKGEIAARRTSLEALSSEEQAERRIAARAFVDRNTSELQTAATVGFETPCPACESPAWMSGELVRLGDPQAHEDVIVQEAIKIPTRLQCAACGLDLIGHGRLHAAGRGGLFSAELSEDPASFYNIQFDLSDVDLAELYEPDYGND
jgi:hypothetical protein